MIMNRISARKFLEKFTDEETFRTILQSIRDTEAETLLVLEPRRTTPLNVSGNTCLMLGQNCTFSSLEYVCAHKLEELSEGHSTPILWAEASEVEDLLEQRFGD